MPAIPTSIAQITFALITAALIIAALVLGKNLILPLTLGAILAFVLSPLLDWLLKRGVHLGIGVALLILATLAGLGASSAIMTSQVATAVATVGDNQANILSKLNWLLRSGGGDSTLGKAKASLDRLQGRIENEITGQSPSSPTGNPAPNGSTAPSSSKAHTSPLSALGAVLDPLATGGLTLLFAAFLLAGRGDLRDRLVRVAGVDNVSATSAALSDVGSSLSHLFLAQLTVNAGFGAFVALALWAIGLPNPVLWGIAAGALRFVPYVGAFIAAVPPMMLAAALEPGWTTLLLTVAVFAVVEPIVGHVIEPLVVGKAVGMSPVAMLVAAAFWTLLWGPVGLLIAAPITTCLVVLGQHVPALRLFNIAFSDAPPLPEDVRLYHRLLSGHEHELVDEVIAATTAQNAGDQGGRQWLDSNVIPGLRLATYDHGLGRLGEEQLERLAGSIDAIATALHTATTPSAATTEMAGDDTDSILPRQKVAVMGARGPVDQALAVLIGKAFAANADAVAATRTGAIAFTEFDQNAQMPDVLVIATVGGADDAQLKALKRRAQQRFPSARVMLCNVGEQSTSRYVEAVASDIAARTAREDASASIDELWAKVALTPSSKEDAVSSALKKLGAETVAKPNAAPAAESATAL